MTRAPSGAAGTRRTRVFRRVRAGGWPLLVAALGAGLFIEPALAAAEGEPARRGAHDASVRRVAETFAKSAVANGLAIGANVGITLRGRHHFFAYGLADVPTGTPTTPDTIYQIGSVTKIFTTAMLGQNIVIGINQLSEPLARFTGELGALDPFTAAVTLASSFADAGRRSRRPPGHLGPRRRAGDAGGARTGPCQNARIPIDIMMPSP